MSLIQLIASISFFGGSLFVTPFLMFVLSIIFLASFGKSLGVRRLYIKLLLKIFEYGRQNIESIKNSQSIKLNDKTESEVASKSQESINTNNTSQNQYNSKPKNIVQNGSGNFISKTYNSNGNTVITRDALILAPDAESNTVPNGYGDTEYNKTSGIENVDDTNNETESIDFNLGNCLDYIKAGVESIIEDEVTSRFEAEELKNWNLLTRTNRNYEFISWRLTVIWVCGFFVRYIILMPLRVLICFIGVAWAVVSFAVIGLVPHKKLRRTLNDVAFKITFRLISRSLSGVITFHNLEYRPRNCGFCVANHTTPMDIAILSIDCTFSLVIWLVICTAAVGCITDGETKSWMVRRISIQCFSILCRALSAVITYHNVQNRPRGTGICVANHTSPIDVLILMCDNCYSLIGQRHGGFLGVLQRALARASPHIWFERAESKDRMAVAQRLRQHVSDPTNPPILIFPEGTCINNTSVMQFKKGSFEVGGVIYPVAIKYDPRFGDPFWNSSKYSMMQYLFLMMTSWAIVCDVWYLPPMYRQEDESAVAFANRVKSVIAKQGGLVDLMWDGNLKRNKPKSEWKERQQEAFTKRLKGE